MTQEQARSVLDRHAGLSADWETGLLGSLRPYRGLDRLHLVEIIEAVHTLVPAICSSTQTDRVLAGTIWDLCFTARHWTCGPREPMFHGRDFIAPTDKAGLDDWLFQLERWMIRLLRTGNDPELTFDWLVFGRLGVADRAGFALPEIIARLRVDCDRDPDFPHDDKVPYCELLAAMGRVAAPAAEVVERLAARTKTQEVRDAAVATLDAIRS